MIKRIIGFSLFGLLVLSLILFFAGVRADNMGSLQVQKFLSNVTRRYNAWSFKIPEIPKIPTIKKYEGAVVGVITALIWIINLIINIVNFIISLVNFLVMFFNTIISIVRFVLTLIYSLKDWINLFAVTFI